MEEANWANQTIWTGDNLLILRDMNTASSTPNALAIDAWKAKPNNPPSAPLPLEIVQAAGVRSIPLPEDRERYMTTKTEITRLERPPIPASRAYEAGLRGATARPEDIEAVEAADAALREKLESKGKGHLHARLKTLDGEAMEAYIREDHGTRAALIEKITETVRQVNKYARREQAQYTKAQQRLEENAAPSEDGQYTPGSVERMLRDFLRQNPTGFKQWFEKGLPALKDAGEISADQFEHLQAYARTLLESSENTAPDD